MAYDKNRPNYTRFALMETLTPKEQKPQNVVCMDAWTYAAHGDSPIRTGKTSDGKEYATIRCSASLPTKQAVRYFGAVDNGEKTVSVWFDAYFSGFTCEGICKYSPTAKQRLNLFGTLKANTYKTKEGTDGVSYTVYVSNWTPMTKKYGESQQATAADGQAAANEPATAGAYTDADYVAISDDEDMPF